MVEIEGAMARLGIQKVIHNQRMEPLTPKKTMIAGMVLNEMANKIIRSAEKKREEDNN